MNKILIVEDDVLIGNAIEELLKLEGYATMRAYSGTEANLILSKKLDTPDLVLLDLNLPGISGEEVLSKIKNIPVIILSAKTSVGDKVSNLLNGACDYITKPFDSTELLARIAVQLRINSADCTEVLRYKDIQINKNTFTVLAGDKEIKVTRTEFAILQLLISNPKKVFSKATIVEKISDYTPDGEESSISVHISSLRHKLRAATEQEYIQTIWGIGFKLI